jgi:hypothetical protein
VCGVQQNWLHGRLSPRAGCLWHVRHDWEKLCNAGSNIQVKFSPRFITQVKLECGFLCAASSIQSAGRHCTTDRHTEEVGTAAMLQRIPQLRLLRCCPETRPTTMPQHNRRSGVLQTSPDDFKTRVCCWPVGVWMAQEQRCVGDTCMFRLWQDRPDLAARIKAFGRGCTALICAINQQL